MGSLINRSAVIVTPKKKFFDWIGEVFEKKDQPSKEEILKDPSIYLVEEVLFSSEDNYREVMKESFLEIAMEEFLAWHTDEQKWPLIKNLKQFEEYFSWKVFDSVVDVNEGDPLERDLESEDGEELDEAIVDFEKLARELFEDGDDKSKN